MKSALFVIGLFVSTAALAEQAPVSTDVTDALNMVAQCPNEFAQVAKLGFISSTVLSSTRNLETVSIVVSSGGLPPTFQIRNEANLLITKTYQPSPQIPDAPGHVTYSCQIINAQK